MPENLPAVADEIIDGEVVDQPRPIPARGVRPVVVAVRPPAVKHTGRHAGYIPAGAYVTAKWLWEVRSGARFDRGMRAASATGNHEAAMKWEELRQKWVAERRRHRMDRARLALEAFRMAPRIAMASAGVLGTVGMLMAIAEKRAAAVEVPFEVVARVVMWVFIAVSVSYGPF